MSQYATVAEFFVYGLPASARGNLADADVSAALVAASGAADSYFRGRYGVDSVPLLAWDTDVTKWVCWIAAYDLLSGPRGYNAAAGADSNIRQRYDDAHVFLAMVQRQALHPSVTPQPAAGTTDIQPLVSSYSVVNLATGGTAARRGW